MWFFVFLKKLFRFGLFYENKNHMMTYFRERRGQKTFYLWGAKSEYWIKF